MKRSTQVFNPMLQKALLFAVMADWNLQPRRLREGGYSCFVQSPRPRSSLVTSRPCGRFQERNCHRWAEALQVPQPINFLQLQPHWPLNGIKIEWVCFSFSLAASCRVCGTGVSQVVLPHFQADQLRKWLQDSHSFSPFFPAGVLCPFKEQIEVLALKRLLICQKPLSELYHSSSSNNFFTQGGQPVYASSSPVAAHLTLSVSPHPLHFHRPGTALWLWLPFWVIPQPPSKCSTRTKSCLRMKEKEVVSVLGYIKSTVNFKNVSNRSKISSLNNQKAVQSAKTCIFNKPQNMPQKVVPAFVEPTAHPVLC